MQELPKDLADATQAAQELDVHVSTVIRWVRAGRVRGWRVGRRYRVSLAEVRALVVPVAAADARPGPRTAEEARIAAAQAVAQLRAKGYKG